MHDLDKALADITLIRQQMAERTLFRGLGPVVIAASGCMAFATAAVQSAWLTGDTPAQPVAFFTIWVALALISSALIGIEMRARTFRHHGGLADSMIANAVENFLPAGVAGATVALIVVQAAPDAAWILPGLWQVLVAIGLFASLRFLPRSVAVAAAWYFLAGVVVLTMGCQTRAVSPWMMGLPFGIGQVLLSAILFIAFGSDNEKVR